MTKLHELASLIRSKNAGPFQLTIDIMFDDQATYDAMSVAHNPYGDGRAASQIGEIVLAYANSPS